MENLTERQRELIESINGWIVALAPQVRDAEDEHLATKEEAARLKKEWESLASQLTRLNMDLVDVVNGNYQKDLFDEKPVVKDAKPAPVDEGGLMPLTALLKFRMTKKKIETVEEACGGSTIAHLEKMLRENAFWHQELKGFGQEWVDRLIDSLTMFRGDHPMPVDEPETQEPDGPQEGPQDEPQSDGEPDPVADAYQFGSDAAEQGIEQEANPHPGGGVLYQRWLDGWLEFRTGQKQDESKGSDDADDADDAENEDSNT